MRSQAERFSADEIDLHLRVEKKQAGFGIATAKRLKPAPCKPLHDPLPQRRDRQRQDAAQQAVEEPGEAQRETLVSVAWHRAGSIAAASKPRRAAASNRAVGEVVHGGPGRRIPARPSRRSPATSPTPKARRLRGPLPRWETESPARSCRRSPCKARRRTVARERRCSFRVLSRSPRQAPHRSRGR
jgi:hypothetical protein